MTDKEMKNWIDEATYKQLLSKWRFAPVGSSWFVGDIGQYYDEAMKRKRSEISDEERVSASKSIDR